MIIHCKTIYNCKDFTNFKDYSNFILRKSLENVNLNRPLLYIFEENNRILLFEWSFLSNWNQSFRFIKNYLKDFPEDILGYALVWKQNLDINIVLQYQNEYMEEFNSEAYICSFDKIAGQKFAKFVKKASVDNLEFFKLLK